MSTWEPTSLPFSEIKLTPTLVTESLPSTVSTLSPTIVLICYNSVDLKTVKSYGYDSSFNYSHLGLTVLLVYIFELKYLNFVLRIEWHSRRDRLISTSDIGQSVDSIVEF